MKKESLITIAVIGGIILLVAGFSLGSSFVQKKLSQIETETPLADLLGSKVISGLTTTASGEITQISGRDLTLNKDGDTLTVTIKEDAFIYQAVPPEEIEGIPQPAAREEMEFGEIKVSNKVSIVCQLKAPGVLEGVDVMVLP